VKITKLESVPKIALNKLENMNKIWSSGELEVKKVFQKSLFPEGIYYDAKNNQFLTRNINQFVDLVSRLSSNFEDIKKEDSQKMLEKSSLVPLVGQLSNRVVKDLIELAMN